MTVGVSETWATDHAPSWTEWQRIATPNHGARTHLWRELDYKLPPSAAVPMRMERAKAKSDAQVIRNFEPSSDSEAFRGKPDHCFTSQLLNPFVSCFYFCIVKTQTDRQFDTRFLRTVLGLMLNVWECAWCLVEDTKCQRHYLSKALLSCDAAKRIS